MGHVAHHDSVLSTHDPRFALRRSAGTTDFVKKKVAVVFGTRPEAIKLAPVVRAAERSQVLEPCVVLTGQHREMLDQMVRFFELRPRRNLAVMTPNQDLADLTGRLLSGLRTVFEEEQPAAILVQGDTTTTFAAALAAYYRRIPTGHVEAGLRTGDPYNPFPEEINRRLTSPICAWHYAPTPWARDNLLREGTPAERILVTGNTIVDAMHDIRLRLEREPPGDEERERLRQIEGRRLVLVTGHRRESFGEGMRNICLALRDIAEAHADVVVLYPVHLNPNVQAPVREILGGQTRVLLTEPLDYLPFARLMQRAHLIITDSGGVQEEAPSVPVPVLVMRETTERPEGVEAGVARLVGTRRDNIVAAARELLTSPDAYRRMTAVANPYGDGHAADRIVAHLEAALADTAAVPDR